MPDKRQKKSSPEQLARRGYLPDEEAHQARFPDRGSIDSALQSSEARLRTAAVRQLRALGDESYIPRLCELLSQEKALYTRLELCECLTEFGPRSVPYLLPRLGKIGDNQHRTISTPDLGKNTFPLPRDLIARILIRMGPGILEELLRFLRDPVDPDALSEALDVIGHISFHSGDRSAEDWLLELYQTTNDPLILWKLLRAFQGFDSAQIEILLREFLDAPQNQHELREEAKRSLKRVTERRERSEQKLQKRKHPPSR